MIQRLAIYLTFGICCSFADHLLAAPSISGIKDFFKTPQSNFRSGQSTIQELSEKRIQSQSIHMTLVEVGEYHEWIPSVGLFNLKDFYHSSDLTPMSAVTKDNAIIYKKINDKWTAYRRFKKGISFTVEQIIGAWACGNFEKDYICVANQELLLAIDFAHLVFTKKGRKLQFKERKEDQIYTYEGITLKWKDLKSWIPHKDVSFVKPHPALPFKGSLTEFEKVNIKDQKIQHWIESQLPDHGKVWWLMNAAIPENTPLIISTEDLKSRGIYDWDTNKNSLALASAQGIFVSAEKDYWKFLPQFGENNFPVAVGPDKTLFIGDQFSLDEGRTFEPYIRWDHLSEMVQNIIQKTPKWIKLTKLHLPQKKSKTVYFEIDTGFQQLSFSTHLESKFIQYLDASKKIPISKSPNLSANESFKKYAE